MASRSTAESLARTWIERWNAGDPDGIPLAEDFRHTSPFGSVQGRQKYLDWVKPLAAKNVTRLTIHRTLAQGDAAVIHFEMQTPAGPVQCCDWVVARGGEIAEIHSFYDASGLKRDD